MAAMAVMRPEPIVKSIIPIVVVENVAICGLVVAMLMQRLKQSP